jgi:hypothetical protein
MVLISHALLNPGVVGAAWLLRQSRTDACNEGHADNGCERRFPNTIHANPPFRISH